MIIFVATAMNNYNKGKAKYILASTVMVLFISVTIGNTSDHTQFYQFYKTLTNDTIPTGTNKKIPEKKNDSISVVDTIPVNAADTTNKIDTVATSIKVDSFIIFNIRTSKDSLDVPVVYHADDSMVLDVPGKKILLYGKESKVTYRTMN